MMIDDVHAKLDYLITLLESIQPRLDAIESKFGPLSEIGDKHAAAQVLGTSMRTVERRHEDWLEGVHYWHEGGKVIYNLLLLRDWRVNRYNPIAHQRAIEAWRKTLLSSQKKRQA